MTAVAEHPASVDVRPSGRHRAGAPTAAPTAHTAYHVITKITGVLGTLLVVLTGLVLLGMTVGPRVFHYQTATMLTGSMAPGIAPGDVVVDVKEKATDLKVGQIITYHIPVDDHRVESHRVIWVGRDTDGTVLFRTKGDANQGADPWTARAEGADVWRVASVLPLAGDVIRFMRQPMVQVALTRVLPVLLVVSVLITVWRRPSSPSDSEETAAS
jgi:signal peptidase